MGNSKKKNNKKQKEEERAGKVVKIVFVSLIVLGLLMMIGFSLMG